MNTLQYRFFALLGLACVATVKADGLVIDKVYHPYVDPLAWELEWRAMPAREEPLSGQQRPQWQRLGLARAVTPTLALEAYVVGAADADHSFSLEAWELEALWQLSEQGEYAIDYGWLVELERLQSSEDWEISSTLLLEREFGRFSGTLNLGLSYEWGETVHEEIDTHAAAQWRYRYREVFEPALELYLGEETVGIGPVVMGLFRLAPMRSLRWEAGLIVGIDSSTPDYTLRALLEYEF